MSKTSATGSELQKQVSSPSEINSAASSELRAWVAAEHQVLKEQIPGPVMSDSAARFLLDKLVELATEIGAERFHQVIVTAIQTCERRPVLATFRRLAGVNPKLDEHIILAWELVTRIVRRHVGWDGNGNAFLRAWTVGCGEVFHEEPVPGVPEGVARAVVAMGGWGALAESYPTYWGPRYAAFRDMLRLSTEDKAMLVGTELATK